ncbi:melanoma antigen recognized by T-cells 1 isoform X1 [Thunnus albacares]|uniref:melanoma antigen recognized by T-cells 1 n=2 Tax=Thunnus TaxID=8234 RepID=UPI001C4C3200|nr:melanoma antigen recognized by T-cells 1 isoform X1 [Thunnus maccoyii]XP_044190379.1 melanoma antigen recognized by T-cells 1 isoform X1 [Thunnus albacares]
MPLSALRHTEERYLGSEITQSSEDPHFLRSHPNQRNCLQSNYPICLMRCNRTDGMPRGDFNIYFASSRRGYVRVEEAVGIALLMVILAALLLLGCWYFKKRSGYRIIRSPRSGSPGYTGGQYSEAGPSADNKMALTDFGSFRPVVPNAPPAYEKISSGPLPPPYSP